MAEQGAEDIVVNKEEKEESPVEGPEGPEGEQERKTSTGSGDILLSQIKVIVRQRSDTEEESDEEEEVKKPKKKTVRRKKKKSDAPSPADVLTKTLAQAIRLINEQKVPHLKSGSL